MKRRILFVIEDFFPLGANLQLKPIADALAAEAFDIHVVALRDSMKLPTWISDLPATIHSLDSGRGINRVLRMRSLIFRVSPNIVHAWGHATHWCSMMAGIGLHELKMVATFFEIPPRHRMNHPQSPAWLFGGSVTLTASHHTIANRLAEHGFDQPIEIIPNSHGRFNWRTQAADHDRIAARQRLLEIISRDIQRPTIQSFNVPPRVGIAEPSSDADAKLYLVGTVARLLPGYQLKDLVWAVDLLCCIRDDIHLFIFGSGPQEPSLRRFISKTASRQHIHLIPAESTDENDLAVLDCYWNAQLEEPLPSAMLAAMAQQIPVVSVLGPGTAELLLPLRSGLATNFGARDEFARWTKYLIEQTNAAGQLAIQSAVHVKKRFPTSQMIEGYRKLYATIEE